MNQNENEIVSQLKSKGIQFADGLTEAEIRRIEEIYDIRFPGSLRRFYSLGVPFSGNSEGEDISPQWENFPETGIAEIKRIEETLNIRFPGSLRRFYSFGVPFADNSEGEDMFPQWNDFSEANIAKIKKRIVAPIYRIWFAIEHDFWLPDWGERPESVDEAIKQFTEIAVTAPRLIPICSHRYMPQLDGADDPPVISAVGRDIIYYGRDLHEYCQNDFRNIEDGEEFIIPQNCAYIPFWSDIINRYSVDKLTFRKKVSKTDVNMAGEEREYILAEAIINGHSLLGHLGDLAKWHEYDYNLAKNLYFELTGELDSCNHWSAECGWTHGWQDGWPGKNKAALFVCGVCFHERDNPLLFEFEETDTAVVWKDFHNPQTKRKYGEIPVFRFEKEQYKTAMAELKKIANESL